MFKKNSFIFRVESRGIVNHNHGQNGATLPEGNRYKQFKKIVY